MKKDLKLHEKEQKKEALLERQRKKRERMAWDHKSIFSLDPEYVCVICGTVSDIIMYGQMLVCSWECFCVEWKRKHELWLAEKRKYVEENKSDNEETDMNIHSPAANALHEDLYFEDYNEIGISNE